MKRYEMSEEDYRQLMDFFNRDIENAEKIIHEPGIQNYEYYRGKIAEAKRAQTRLSLFMDEVEHAEIETEEE